MRCAQTHTARGSLCAIPVPAPNTTSAADYNEVLPCVRQFVPRTTRDGGILPQTLNDFMQGIPSQIRGCRGRGESAGLRMSIPPPNGHSYDVTQCDFHDGGVSALYINSDSTIYMVYGQDLVGSQYVLAGIVIVTIVACMAQNIVHLLNNKGNRAARGDISLMACVAGLLIVVCSMENGSPGSRVLVTQEVLLLCHASLFPHFLSLPPHLSPRHTHTHTVTGGHFILVHGHLLCGPHQRCPTAGHQPNTCGSSSSGVGRRR